MVSSLTELVRMYPENTLVIECWVEGVFPLILDVEQKAAEKVQEVNEFDQNKLLHPENILSEMFVN